MRIGLPVSVFSHTALVALGVISLNFGQPLDPQVIESISVDIIPITQFSNIREGKLESEIVDTPTPAIVDTPDPAQLAERTGNTQEDQVKPLDNEKVTPAPTEQTAPEPVPVPDPVPDPEPKPDPAPVPAPVPEPTPAPEPTPEQPPVPAEVETVITSPAETAVEPVAPTPRPVVRTAALDQKREDYARRQREQAEAAAEAHKVSEIINAEQSRGATTGQGGQATLGKETGQAATLTRSEQDALAAQMRQCWRLLPGEIDSGLSVRLMVDLNRDGSVVGTPRVISQITSPIQGSIARAAQRAVLGCGPYRLAVEKYEEWKQIDVTFRASDLS
jgi:hypothetical protein